MNKLLLTGMLSMFLILSITAQELLTPAEQKIKRLEECGDDAIIRAGENYYTPLSISWTSTLDAPSPFGRVVGGQIGNYVYVFASQGNTSLAIAYNLSDNTWSNSTPCIDLGYNSGFCVANGELYKIAGTSADTTLEKFTPDGTGTGTWSILQGGPSDIMNAQNAIVWDGGNYIYAHSSNYSTTSPASYLSRYSISGNSWINLTPTTLIKRYPGLQYHNGYIYLIGGLVPTGGDQTACAKYDISNDTWSSIAPLPEGLNFCKWTTTTVNDYIVVVSSGGGYSTYPSNPKIFYYNTNDNTWTYDSDVPAERGLALAFFMNPQGKLFYGGGNSGGSTNYQVNCWTGDGGFIPVELISFSADVSGNDVLLSWMTATETNNSHFEIQRSIDGTVFERIGNVAGNGTTTETHHYTFKDNNLTAGKYYYRLKQFDLNGTFEFSNVIEANIISPDKFELLQNYPNPFNPSTTINFSILKNEFVNLKVFDVMGNEVAELVNEEKSAGLHSIEFDASGFASGTYFYKLQAGGRTEVKKMLLLK
jgi:hypothetical protein